MKYFFKLLVSLATGLSLTGCLATRNQLRNEESRKESQETMAAQQQARYLDLESDVRSLTGRIASLENSLSQVSADRQSIEKKIDSVLNQTDAKLKIYQEAFDKIEKQYLLLSQKVEALQVAVSQAAKSTAPVSRSGSVASSANTKTDFFKLAEDDFKNKRFRQAIVNYQKYREANPRGAQYAEATYKMGQSFINLNMKDEATPFFNEVIDKFPKSQAATKARESLKKR